MRSTRSDDGVVVPFARRTLVGGRCSRHLDRVHLADLLLRAARRDTGAFMHFYDHTSGAAYRIATAVTGDREAAEDLVRDLYVRAWQHAGRHRWSGLSPVTWLLAPALERRSCLTARTGMPQTEAAAHG
jgi:RNA polymerase sigma-70 factor (ECF subfamily)